MKQYLQIITLITLALLINTRAVGQSPALAPEIHLESLRDVLIHSKDELKEVSAQRIAWWAILLTEQDEINDTSGRILNEIEDEFGTIKLRSAVFFSEERASVLKTFMIDGQVRYRYLFQAIRAARERSQKAGSAWPSYVGKVYGDM